MICLFGSLIVSQARLVLVVSMTHIHDMFVWFLDCWLIRLVLLVSMICLFGSLIVSLAALDHHIRRHTKG